MDRRLEIKQELSNLPLGYVTKKTIGGKAYFYHQWLEEGKTKSIILKENEVKSLKEKIERRKSLQKELKELNRIKDTKNAKTEMPSEFILNVTLGTDLENFIESGSSFQKRDCFQKIEKYVKGRAEDKVCVIYGLRRTGKTTLLKQIMHFSLSEDERSKTVYIKARTTDKIASLNQDIQKLKGLGFKYFFIDEITLIEDFIDNAALLSDVYAAQGLKFVLSGTDSLGFFFSTEDELYDRTVMVHTTFIPFREHSRLLNVNDIDEYIRYGGTLRVGEVSFDDRELDSEEASFRDDESTRRYIDTAICKNIQHSLKCYKNGRYFRHLRELYEADELTNAINRIIENENHDFTVKVITDIFESHDLGSTAQLLRKSRDEEKRTNILDKIDKSQILSTVKKILEIKEKEEQKIGITETHTTEIKQYLKRLDLIDELKIETMTDGEETLSYTIFTQPGMRFCQAQALVYSVVNDEQIKFLDKKLINLIAEKIIDGVLGHMLEDIVIYETKKILMPKKYGNKKEVYQIRFEAGEFDMLIYDTESNTCEIYEIKHSVERTSHQYRHLIDEEKVSLTEKKFGKVTKKCVLYKGENFSEPNGIEYKNVEEFLYKIEQLSGNTSSIYLQPRKSVY